MPYRSWLVFALLASGGLASAQERVWTSADGRTLRGEFVRELDGEVTFLVEGKLTTVPLEGLSDRDQEIVRNLSSGKGLPDDPAPPSAAPLPASDPVSPDRPAPLVKKPKPPVNRLWTETQGRQYTAKFVRIFDGKVVLTRAGGTLSIPYFDLSAADQEYVQELLTLRGEEALIPTHPPAAAGGSTGGPRHPGAFGPMRPGAAAPGLKPPGSDPASSPPAGMPIRPLDSGITPPPAFVPSSGDDVYSGSGPGSSGPSSYGPSGSAPRSLPEPAKFQGEPQRPEQIDPAQSMFKSVPVCSACRSTLTDSEAQGSQCPRCGARWAFNLHKGSSAPAATAASSQSSTARSAAKWEFLEDPQNKRAVYGGIAVVVVLAVVAAIVIGVLAVAFAVASASRASRQYNDSGRL